MPVKHINRERKDSSTESLYRAVQKFDRKGVETILGKGTNINELSSVGKTPLIRAVMNCDQKLIDYLVEKGADLNACDKRGWTALHYAAYFGSVHLVKQLVRKGADTGITDKAGRSALDVARARLDKSMERRYPILNPNDIEVYDAAEGPKRVVGYLERRH